MAENESVSLETLLEQQKQLSEAVSSLTATRSQLEEQLVAVRNNLATNAGALQYANALIQSITGEVPGAAAAEGDEEGQTIPVEGVLEDEEVSL